uniref:HMG box domain-containing protein n=1 Tax=Glossina brevipalpis TaxID=37001 RepID=A0A1A9WNW6_9MUSC
MASIWECVCSLIANIMKRKQRKELALSPSSLHRHFQFENGRTPSVNPFFNFLTEVRKKGVQSKAAGRLWKCMSDQEKKPYRSIAVQEQKLKRLGPRRKSIRTSLPRSCNNSKAILRNRNSQLNAHLDTFGAGGDCGF